MSIDICLFCTEIPKLELTSQNSWQLTNCTHSSTNQHLKILLSGLLVHNWANPGFPLKKIQSGFGRMREMKEKVFSKQRAAEPSLLTVDTVQCMFWFSCSLSNPGKR